MPLKNIERQVRRLALKCVGRLFPVVFVTIGDLHQRLGEGQPRKIIFVGTSMGLGQFLCATPLLRAFRETWPSVSLHFLGNPVNERIACGNPCLEKVWVWKKGSFRNMVSLVHALKNEKYDLALLLTTEMPSTTGILMARLCGASCVAGYGFSSLYHMPIPYHPVDSEVEKFLGLAWALGLKSSGRGPEFVPTPEDRRHVQLFLGSHGLSQKRPRVGLFLGGKVDRPGRLWPAGHFARLARSLFGLGASVIAVAPPPSSGRPSSYRSGEDARLNEFLRDLAAPCDVFQESDIGSVAALLEELDLLICPDGGIMHLSVAVGTPTLALFFETNPGVWHHRERRHYYLDGRGQPSSSLLPEIVFMETMKILKAPTPPA